MAQGAPSSGVSSAPDWGNAPRLHPSSSYSRLQEHQHSQSKKCSRTHKFSNTPRDNWGKTHPELSEFSFFFLQDQELCVLAEGFTHLILLPLLAFLSTFFFILLRNFWMANHCLGDAEQQEHNFRATEHSQKKTPWSPTVLKASLLNQNFLKSNKFPAGKNFSWL